MKAAALVIAALIALTAVSNAHDHATYSSPPDTHTTRIHQH